MIEKVKIPEIAENVESGTVTEILVAEGDQIEEEQSIITVETDKASVEIPSPISGKIQEIKVKKNDEVHVGTVILTLETGNGTAKSKDNKKGDKKDKKEDKKESKKEDKKEKGKDKKKDKDKDKDREKEKEEEVRKKKQEIKEKVEDQKRQREEKQKKERQEREAEPSDGAPSSPKEAPASPLARRVARELEVDIGQVEGSGPGGRITEDDIRAKAEAKKEDKGKQAKTDSASDGELPDFSQWGTVSRERMSNVRLTIAQKTSGAWHSIPHVTHFDQADLTLANAFLEENAGEAEEAGGKLTLTALLVKLVAMALEQFPVFNASIDLANEQVIFKQYYHIGLAVDTERGLLLPVLRDVDQMTLVEVAVAITKLAEQAREKELEPEAFQGGCFSVTNLGGIGGTQFTPLIYPPQVAILGLSRATMQPVYQDGRFEPHPILPLALSYDHRLIDGADAARFMNWLTSALENPLSIL